MSNHPSSVAASVLAAALVVAVAGCGASPSGSAWDPATSEPTVAPSASPLAPSSAVPTAPPSTPSPPAASPARSSTPAPAAGPGLTDEEWAVIATPWAIERLPASDPAPAIDPAAAERIVRDLYPGDRPLVWVGLVSYGGDARVGWMVVLGTAPGQACNIHPGLLERALEGGIVDAATGELFFAMTCG